MVVAGGGVMVSGYGAVSGVCHREMAGMESLEENQKSWRGGQGGVSCLAIGVCVGGMGRGVFQGNLSHIFYRIAVEFHGWAGRYSRKQSTGGE